MILNNTTENNPILSNVGQIGEFRIRNSAKAFGILSSGLYANKIRAIIRELSCNAVDSHVAAGRADEPFELHLPTALEPWFGVRDFGVGLSHDQVINIYTTYFESTKTASNEFIGALGLGSKSPFSYTENFSVTAIQNGRMGIYTAFINEQGVPSIALMSESQTEDRNGVEVKFAVTELNDFDKFRQEAVKLMRWFTLRPTVTGVYRFEVEELNYETKDIIPGVHQLSETRYSSYQNSSFAVMGNIAYPIEVPNAKANLGDLHHMLDCGLVMHFNIGELEFQASREGLSYVPQTIAVIKSKLEQVSSALTDRLAVEIDQFSNVWDRYFAIRKRYSQPLWTKATYTYLIKNPNPWIKQGNGGYQSAHIHLIVDELAAKYNIKMTVLSKQAYASHFGTVQPDRQWDSAKQEYGPNFWDFAVNDGRLQLVINDTKSGATERIKQHLRAKQFNGTIWYCTASDREKPMLIDEFLTLLHNPPEKFVLYASSTDRIERKKGLAAGVSLLSLGWTGYGRHRALTWSEVGSLDNLDATKTYYYVPLSGFELISQFPNKDVKKLVEAYEDVTGTSVTVYGVRKKDMEQISSLPNWINLEQHIIEYLNGIKPAEFTQMSLQAVPNSGTLLELYRLLKGSMPKQGMFYENLTKYVGKQTRMFNLTSLGDLCNNYKDALTVQPMKEFQNFKKFLAKDFDEVMNRYPLLVHINQYSAPKQAIVEYITTIDKNL